MQIDKATVQWATQVAQKFDKKLRAVRQRSAEKIPAQAISGVHDDKGDSTPRPENDGLAWWTNGFWAGMMWQMYHDTRDEAYASVARYTEKRLDECFQTYLGLHHDTGFMWLPSAVANYRITGNSDAYRRGMHAANLLAGRYNPAGFIRAWNDIPGAKDDTRGWAIIDCMFNIPLLYWASEETKDPRFQKIAVLHADTAAKSFIREDGSVRHIVEFNPETGEFVRDYGGQGYAQGSSWTRGQAWALYGFVMSYKHTHTPAYLQTAQKVADYFLKHIPQNGRIPVDFCQPAQPEWYDDIAGAVAACGYIELAALLPQREESYMQAALKMLKAIDATADWSTETDGILQYCSPAYHADVHNVNYTYGDYYFLEAVLKLKGTELYIW